MFRNPSASDLGTAPSAACIGATSSAMPRAQYDLSTGAAPRGRAARTRPAKPPDEMRCGYATGKLLSPTRNCSVLDSVGSQTFGPSAVALPDSLQAFLRIFDDNAGTPFGRVVRIAGAASQRSKIAHQRPKRSAQVWIAACLFHAFLYHARRNCRR